jgi:hypothetical protein
MTKVEAPIEKIEVPKGYREAREQIVDAHAETFEAQEAGKPFKWLGLTVLGWISSLKWALMKDSFPTEVIENHPVPEWVHCTSCGTYSSPGSKFCSTCGKQITTDAP